MMALIVWFPHVANTLKRGLKGKIKEVFKVKEIVLD